MSIKTIGFCQVGKEWTFIGSIVLENSLAPVDLTVSHEPVSCIPVSWIHQEKSKFLEK